MTTVTWSQGNNGIYGYDDLSHMIWESDAFVGPNLVESFKIFDTDNFTYDSNSVFRVRALVELNGPDPETSAFVIGYEFFDQGGDLLMTASGMYAPLTDLATSPNHNGEYAMNSDAYSVSIDAGATFIGANNLGGADWGDSIITGNGDDVVRANGGDDWISDIGGTDSYNGGKGNDWVTYTNSYDSGSGITVNLGSKQIIDTEGNTDTLVSIENARGTDYDDSFRGNTKNNGFEGRAGVDSYDGRGGRDLVRFDKEVESGGTHGVTVNLKHGFAIDSWDNRETLRSIEGARGTQFRDKFIDNGGSDYYRGEAGKDVFKMAGGNDTINGGGGRDTFIFVGKNFGDDTIQDFDVTGGDRIKIAKAGNFADLTIGDDGSGNAEIAWSGNTVILTGVDFNDLSASDFIF